MHTFLCMSDLKLSWGTGTLAEEAFVSWGAVTGRNAEGMRWGVMQGGNEDQAPFCICIWACSALTISSSGSIMCSKQGWPHDQVHKCSVVVWWCLKRYIWVSPVAVALAASRR